MLFGLRITVPSIVAGAGTKNRRYKHTLIHRAPCLRGIGYESAARNFKILFENDEYEDFFRPHFQVDGYRVPKIFMLGVWCQLILKRMLQ